MDIPKSDKEEIISKLKESIKTTNMLSFYSQDTLKIIDTYKDKPYYNLLKEKLSNEASFMKENVYFLYTRDHTKKYSSEKYKTIFNNLRNNKIKK